MKSKLSFFAGVLSVLSLPVAGFAQASSSPVINRPDSIQADGAIGYWSHMDGQGRAGGVLLGKVAVADDPVPWDPVFVYVICEAKVAYATYTDPKGGFVITAVNIAGSLSLQEDAKRQMETHLEGCRVMASLAGFHSSVIVISHRNLRDDPDIGVLTLARDEKLLGTAVSPTTASAPANALKAYTRARQDVIDKNPDSAMHDLQQAVEIYPKFADAWYQLGRLQQATDAAEARKSYAQAVVADPQFLLPYEQLAALDVHDGKWKEVAGNTGKALELDPAGTPETWYYDALANFELGNIDVAQSSAQHSMDMDPQHAIANSEQLLAAILARKRDYASAIQHLQNCITYSSNAKRTEELKRSIAKLEQLQNAPQK